MTKSREQREKLDLVNLMNCYFYFEERIIDKFSHVFIKHEWTKKRNFSLFVILFFVFFSSCICYFFQPVLCLEDIRWQENSRKLTSVCAPLPPPPPESIRSNADGIR